MRGRRPVGPEYADQLAGSDTAKLRTKVILETMMGELRLKEACERLGICEQRFHQLREEMMTAAVQALEPGQAGRPAHTPTPAVNKAGKKPRKRRVARALSVAERLKQEMVPTTGTPTASPSSEAV